MTAPAVTSVTAGAWTKVATNVQDVSIQAMQNTARYFWTYRDTGDPAPTLATEKVPFRDSTVTITAGSGIDVYVWVEATSYITAASVRVDAGLNVTYLIDG